MTDAHSSVHHWLAPESCDRLGLPGIIHDKRKGRDAAPLGPPGADDADVMDGTDR